MNYKYFIASLVLFRICDAKVGFSEINNSYSLLAQCATKIISNLVNKIDRPVVDLTTFNLNHSTVFESFHRIKGVRIVTRTLLTQPNRTVYNEVCLVICQDFAELREGIESSRRDSLWNPTAKFIIIFKQTIDDDVKDIFHFLMDKFLFNSTVIAKFSFQKEYYVLSSTPDWSEVCVGSKIGTINVLTSCSDLNDDSDIFRNNFPRKLNGCKIKMISHFYSPFTTLSRGEDKNVLGIDEYLLKLLSHSEGFEIELVDYGKIEDFGRVLDNYTYTGMLKYIEDDSTIVGACGGHMLTWLRTRGLDFLAPYIVDQILLVIPRATTFDTWSAVATELSFITSALILIYFIIFCVMIIKFSVFTNCKNDNVKSVLYVWCLFFSTVNVKYVRNSISGRFIALSLYIFIILLYCVIQASLLRESTSPKPRYQMKEIEEVFESDLELIVSPGVAGYLKMLNDTHTLKLAERRQVCKSTLHCLIQVKNAYNRSLFTMSSSLYHKSYMWKLAEPDGSLKIFTIPRTFAITWQTMYFHRGFPFLKSMNKRVYDIAASGLLFKHMDDMDFNERKKYHFHESPRFVPITLIDLRYGFWILAFGWCLAIIVFIYENNYMLFIGLNILEQPCQKKNVNR